MESLIRLDNLLLVLMTYFHPLKLNSIGKGIADTKVYQESLEFWEEKG
jgi:hypothetical protein